MTIRLKVILIVIFSVVALTLTMYVVTQTVLLKSYINIENDEAVKNLERADNAIQKVLEGLGLTVKDWTTWDPPYSFVQGKNPSFKDTDLTTLGMVNIKLNAMVFVNTDHKVVFSKMVDLKTSTDIDPEGLVAYITAHDQLITEVFQNGSASGIVDLPSGPMFLAMHTIIHSDGSGPPAGVLVFGKDLNEDVVKSLEDSTNLSIGLYPYNSTLLSDDITMAIKMLSGGVKFHIQYVSDQNMAVHKLINDISGAPVLVMRVETPRPIYNQGKSSLYFFMALAVAMTLLFGAIILFFIEYFLVARLSKLQTMVTNIAETRNFSTQLKDNSRDELGKLTSAINYMLVNLAEANKSLEEMTKQLQKEVVQKTQEFEKSVEGYQSENQLLQKNIDALERINLAAIERELKMGELKKENESLKNQS